MLENEILKAVEKDKALQAYRKKVSARKFHIFSMSVEGFKAKIYMGIQAQRGKKIRVSDLQDRKITDAIDTYAKKLYSIFSSGGNDKFKYKLIGKNSSNFKVKIEGDGLIDQHLASIREQAGLRRVSNIVKNTFKSISDDSKIVFDLSHLEGSTIADQFARDALAKYEASGFFPADKQAYEQLSARVKRTPGKRTIATVEVEDTFWYLNQSTTEEAYVLGLLRKATGDYLEKEGVNLVQEELTFITNRLLKAGKKAGAKTSKLLPEPKASDKTASSKKPIKSSRSTKSIEQLTDKVEVIERNQQQSWSLLIPKINAMLHDRIRANMVAPRLVYRTGKFASSVEVTRVETTKQGYPVFVADYERSPYQVFDRALGAPPWNTPQRDPKALIGMSIREVMRTMVVGRFYVKIDQNLAEGKGR